MAAGFAMEFAIKATIMKLNGYNAWPSRELRPDLYQHDLRTLLRASGLSLGGHSAKRSAAIRMALDWSRRHDYHASAMPRRVAHGMVEAAFGDEGVIAWLRSI